MSSKIERDKIIELHSKMIEIRLFEEKVFELYAQNLVPGTIHLYTGEEAVAVGVCSNLRKDDYITSTHRGHGHCLAKGAEPGQVMAEILGKRTGYCKGKGGSMHIADFKVGMLGATAVVGGGLPIAVGAGLSIQLKRRDNVVACFFGDGASNQGTFHESINMASIWSLPVIFVCENNIYAMGTRQSTAMLIENISERAASYGIPGETVDGNDVLAVYKAARKAVENARKGKGPTLIECKTYRHRGHSRIDPAKYRPIEEVDHWLKKDPIIRLKKKILDEKLLDEADIKNIEREVSNEIEEAVRFAKESEHPKPQEALEDVYTKT
ncbi:MAG: pyruvate dehydrogenase (acetyl-transferring) E1 component subunit alpha [Candidatus Bathyarchaeota archaeon]